jgi:catechol 2,3-dioxygenase-like lactoylglutathione lyase family enzyme
MEEAVEKLKTDGVRLISQEPRPFENDRVFFFKGLNGEKLEFVQIGE